MDAEHIQPLERRTLVVHDPHGPGQRISRDRLARNILHLLLEVLHLFQPHHAVPLPLHLRDLHDIGRHLAVEQLPGLLLGVAGRLTVHEVD